MFLFIALPSIFENTIDQWNRILGPKLSEEDIKAIFYAHPAYLTFVEKYPDTGEDFDIRGSRSASLRLTVFNYTSNNNLNLYMDWNQRDQKLNVDVRCEWFFDENQRHLGVDGGMAANFINNTKCVEQ